MSEENQRLKKELMDAKINDFVRDERYKVLVSELEAFKNKASFLENETGNAVETELEEIKEEKVNIENQVIEESKEQIQKVESQEVEESKEERKTEKECLPEANLETEENLSERRPGNRNVRLSRKMIASPKPLPEIVTVKDRKEAHKADKECKEPQKARKAERKLIIFDLEPDQPQMDRRFFSSLSRPTPRCVPPQQDQEDNCIIFRDERFK
ncbi:uncharacterized protein PF3D7_1120000-like [Macrobrachium rosenbergii]|uniref:uncharacterized protein PF3D7_1120000-like n=1 Tax=Macrobrachium rosenbergii TaxID=79674 RepID=UPI0034D3D660